MGKGGPHRGSALACAVFAAFHSANLRAGSSASENRVNEEPPAQHRTLDSPPTLLATVAQPPQPPRRQVDEEVIRSAQAAGAYYAPYWAERRGWCQAYLAGLSHGLHAAILARTSDISERQRGRKEGSADPAAQRGRERGWQEGSERGMTDGASAAAERFRAILDTGRDPDLNDAPPPHRYTGAEDGYRRSYGELPTLRDLMRRHPFAASSGSDGYELYECDFHAWDLYDLHPRDPSEERPWFRWRQPRWAFEQWAGGDGAWTRTLDPRQQELARANFELAYLRELDLNRAGGDGWWRSRGERDGWEYGSAIGALWQYETGRAEGFDAAYRRASLEGFASAYADAYRGAFRREVTVFMNAPQLDFSVIALTDAGGDGMFEPGEGLDAQIAIVNLGRVGISLSYGLEGSPLAETMEYWNFIGPSARLKTGTFLSRAAVVSPDARSWDRLSVFLRVNGEASPDFYRTLEFPVGLAHAGLVEFAAAKGSGRVQVVLANRSPDRDRFLLLLQLWARRGEGGEILLDQKTVTEVPAGASASVELGVAGLSPLTLMRNEFSLFARLGNSYGVVLGQAGLDLPRSRDDAPLYLVEMAKAGAADHPEWRGTADWIAAAVRSEWREVALSGGNPYRDDRRGTNRPPATYAGRLAEIAERHAAEFRSHEPFRRLVPLLMPIGDPYGKSHPRLRKWYARLIESLGKAPSPPARFAPDSSPGRRPGRLTNGRETE